MSSYDIEREKQKSEEIRKVFREMFPLANENDLPWATCHIKDFLKKRIELEVERGTTHFVSEIARVLCEVTHPKTHMVDMARAVVEKAKKVEMLQQENEKLKVLRDELRTERGNLQERIKQLETGVK